MHKFRRLALCLLSVVFLLLNTGGLAYGCPFHLFKSSSSKCGSGCNVETLISTSIPKNIEANIKESITKVYGEDKVNEIYPNIVEKIQQVRENRPAWLYSEDLKRDSDWYKDEIIYMFYVDQLGTIRDGEGNSFKDTALMLDYLQDLGITTIFMLPFLDSPMGDAGFDVRNPKDVRADLGGLKEFKYFVKEARKRGLKIKADLILNHFSDQHKWFQQALAGDTEKATYFVMRKEIPPYKSYLDENIGYVVEYKEEDGKTSKRRLIFPEITPTHYRKVNLNNEDYYFYHTFYPFQIDVNWKNPDVLYYMLDVIGHWANIGVDIFRMDAIPYFIKEPGTNAENLPKTHAIVQLLSSYIQAVAPRSVMQAEACQWPKDILPYFGDEKEVKHNVLCNNKKEIKRTDEVQIAYHFPYMPAIWASLLTQNSEHFWDAYATTPQIPDSATWAVFLRVHDELTLEMVDVETRKLLYSKLVNKGVEFRKGFGVAGRMANFLDNDPEKIGLAFSVLMSMPGIPIIYYGDEIGAQNNWNYAKYAEAEREKAQKAKDPNIDVISFFDGRDINRGPIKKDVFYAAANEDNTLRGKIHKKVKSLISARKANPIVRRGDFTPIEANLDSVFAYLRTYNDEKLIMVNNLSDKPTIANLTLTKEIAKKVCKNKTFTDLITNKTIRLNKKSDNEVQVGLKPYQSLWIKL